MTKEVYDFRDNIPYGSFSSLDEFSWYTGRSPRFRHASALYSPGYAETDPEKARIAEKVLLERDRNKTFLLVDSGGFQLGRGKWKLSELDKKIREVLRWQEAISDLAVILEVPRWMELDSARIEFSKALELTNNSLKAYAEQCTGTVKFLNPLHGDSFDEGRRWFDKTKWFNDQGFAVGWCFGSLFSHNFYEALKMLLYMIEQEHYPRYLHFLGQGSPQAALVAAMMRRTVPRCYPPLTHSGPSEQPLIVTVDSSSEFQSTGKYGLIYERSAREFSTRASASPFAIKSTKFESKDRSRFPEDRAYPDVEGPILGKYQKGVVFGDILAPRQNISRGGYNLDEVSSAILVAHNLWVKLDAYERLFDLERLMRRLGYGKREQSTEEFAGIVERLLRDDEVSAAGKDLIECTVGLWSIFRSELNHSARAALLDDISVAASRLFV